MREMKMELADFAFHIFKRYIFARLLCKGLLASLFWRAFGGWFFLSLFLFCEAVTKVHCMRAFSIIVKRNGTVACTISDRQSWIKVNCLGANTHNGKRHIVFGMISPCALSMLHFSTHGTILKIQSITSRLLVLPFSLFETHSSSSS